MRSIILTIPLLLLLSTIDAGAQSGINDFETEQRGSNRQTGGIDVNTIIPVSLRVAATSTIVRIRWGIPPSYTGLYGIWRHTVPIHSFTFPTAQQIAVVETPTNQYLDVPDSGGTFFYAVFPIGRSGRPILIYENDRTVARVKVEITENAAILSRTSQIVHLDATQSGDQIELRFLTTRNDRQLYVYRSEFQFRSLSDLKNALRIGTIPSSQTTFFDMPDVGRDYYYALVDTLLIGEFPNLVDFREGVNFASVVLLSPSPSYVKLPPYTEPITRRNLVLPSLSGLQNHNNLMTLRTLDSPETTSEEYQDKEEFNAPEPIEPVQIVNGIQLLRPMTLPEDRSPTTNRASLQLQRVLQSEFVSRRWISTLRMLEDLLATVTNPAVLERIHYYRGQCLYFVGEYRNAILAFLLSGDDLATERQAWIDSAILLLSS